MNLNIVYITVICFIVFSSGGVLAFVNLLPYPTKTISSPLVVDEKAKEVRFSAILKKPKHPGGYGPTILATPNSLVNEKVGGALLAAALVAEEGVTAEKLTKALEKINLNAGQNIALDEWVKTAKGDPVNIYIDTGSKRFLIDDVIKEAFPTAKTNFVFLGNYRVQQKMDCGCLICGRSGPGTVLANAAYMTGEASLIGPTLHIGLLKKGLHDNDKVTIIVTKRTP